MTSLIHTTTVNDTFYAGIKEGAPLWVTPELLDDMLEAQHKFQVSLCKFNLIYREDGATKPFLLGGDLQYMVDCIENNKRTELSGYGKRCTDLVWNNWTTFGDPARVTMTYLQGSAYGGGAEAALSSSIILGCKNSAIHFPEWMFSAFPGMGALPVLTKRCGRPKAIELISRAAKTNAAQMIEYGLMDVALEGDETPDQAAEHGKSYYFMKRGVWDFIRLADIEQFNRREFYQYNDYWCDFMMDLDERALKHMKFLIRAQRRLK
jgi:DSF synthase